MDPETVGYFSASKETKLTTSQRRRLKRQLQSQKKSKGENWLPIEEYRKKQRSEKLQNFTSLPLEEKIKIFGSSLIDNTVINIKFSESLRLTSKLLDKLPKPSHRDRLDRYFISIIEYNKQKRLE